MNDTETEKGCNSGMVINLTIHKTMLHKQYDSLASVKFLQKVIISHKNVETRRGKQMANNSEQLLYYLTYPSTKKYDTNFKFAIMSRTSFFLLPF